VGRRTGSTRLVVHLAPSAQAPIVWHRKRSGTDAPTASFVRRDEEAVMTEIWIYEDEGWVDGPELIGYDVEATDGSIGKIDESTKEADRQSVVVDTGFWIFGKKRLIPAGVITLIDHEERRVEVGMTKDQIKDAPDFDESRRDDDEDRRRHEEYYSSTRR
jgi:hypothetical protein